MKRIAFITGGTGFVGSNLIPFLVEKGYQLKVLVRKNSEFDKIKSIGETPILGDLLEIESFEDHLIGVETVFHLAASVDFFAPEEELRELHVNATKNLINKSKSSGVRRFIYLGAASVAIDGKPKQGINEDFVPKKFQDGYSKTKYETEQLVLSKNKSDFKTISIRPPMIWGKNDPNTLPAIIDAIKKKQFMMIGGGNHQFVTCHVINVCHSLFLADNTPNTSKAYFVTDLEEPNFKNFISRYVASQGIQLPNKSVSLGMAKLFANLMEIIWKLLSLKDQPPIYRGLVNVLGMEFTVNNSRIINDLNYSPIISIDEGISKM